MTFRELTVKEFFEDPRLVAIAEEEMPGAVEGTLTRTVNKTPGFARKIVKEMKCGMLLDLIVSRGTVPKENAQEIERRINELLAQSEE